MRRIIVLLLALMVLSACARLPLRSESPHVGQDGPLGECATLLALVDSAVQKAGVRDPGPYRIEHYPYLRVDRFLTSFTSEVNMQARYDDWVERMQVLDLNARRHEISNLPGAERARLFPGLEMEAVMDRVAQCGDVLRREDLSSATQRESLLQHAKVPAEYIGIRRVLGIYPFVSLFVSNGVDKWHAEARQTFTNTPPTNWNKQRFSPVETQLTTDPGRLMRQVRKDHLGIPQFTVRERSILFELYAPIWEVQQAGSFDLIGQPMWSAAGKLSLDPMRPTVYRHVSFSRFRSEVLTQLNYVIWFSERPKTSAWDIFGGFLDGVNYRVTLDINGQPLLFETVHNCGCYHKYYPTQWLASRPVKPHKEPPLILKAPAFNPMQDRLVISMFSGTHYVNHLYTVARGRPATGVNYAMEDYDRLRSLPYSGDRRRSMFHEDSIVPGSQRLERWLLWPTGVLSPGAMRQWGRHAVAFVGQRHFDDPYLIESIFHVTTSEN